MKKIAVLGAFLLVLIGCPSTYSVIDPGTPRESIPFSKKYTVLGDVSIVVPLYQEGAELPTGPRTAIIEKAKEMYGDVDDVIDITSFSIVRRSYYPFSGTTVYETKIIMEGVAIKYQ